jgi:hypothetical protein
VRTDGSALSRSATGSITGPLSVEIDGDPFPEPGWNDFPVVVLGWWLRAVLALKRTGVGTSCTFMDGPFEFELKQLQPRAWELLLLERRVADVQVVRSGRVDPEQVLLSIHAAADSVLQGCRARNWSSPDIDELQSARNALSQ